MPSRPPWTRGQVVSSRPWSQRRALAITAPYPARPMLGPRPPTLPPARLASNAPPPVMVGRPRPANRSRRYQACNQDRCDRPRASPCSTRRSPWHRRGGRAALQKATWVPATRHALPRPMPPPHPGHAHGRASRGRNQYPAPAHPRRRRAPPPAAPRHRLPLP